MRSSIISRVEFRLSHAIMDRSYIKRYIIDAIDKIRSEIIQQFAYHGVCWERGPHSPYLHKTFMRIACLSAHCASSIWSNQHPLIVSNTWSTPTTLYCTCELNWDRLVFSLLKGMQCANRQVWSTNKTLQENTELGHDPNA